jgi:hypothetical protein
VYNCSDPLNPVLIRSLRAADNGNLRAHGAAYWNGFIYVSDATLSVIYYYNDSSTNPMGTVELTSGTYITPQALSIQNGLLLIAADSGTYLFDDTSMPGNYVLICSYADFESLWCSILQSILWT